MVEERPDFALEAIAAVERGLGHHPDTRLRICAIRTLGVIGALREEARPRVLTVLCENLLKLLEAEDKGGGNKDKRKRFSLRRWRSKSAGQDLTTSLGVALVRSIRATGRKSSAPIWVLQAACRVQDVATVRHTLALMLCSHAERGAVIDALLQMLESEWHANSVSSDVLASMYLSRLCVAVSSGVAGTAASAKKVEALAEGRRRQALQAGPDALFLHALRTCSRPHTLPPGPCPPPPCPAHAAPVLHVVMLVGQGPGGTWCRGLLRHDCMRRVCRVFRRSHPETGPAAPGEALSPSDGHRPLCLEQRAADATRRCSAGQLWPHVRRCRRCLLVCPRSLIDGWEHLYDAWQHVGRWQRSCDSRRPGMQPLPSKRRRCSAWQRASGVLLRLCASSSRLCAPSCFPAAASHCRYLHILSYPHVLRARGRRCVEAQMRSGYKPCARAHAFRSLSSHALQLALNATRVNICASSSVRPRSPFFCFACMAVCLCECACARTSILCISVDKVWSESGLQVQALCTLVWIQDEEEVEELADLISDVLLRASTRAQVHQTLESSWAAHRRPLPTWAAATVMDALLQRCRLHPRLAPLLLHVSLPLPPLFTFCHAVTALALLLLSCYSLAALLLLSCECAVRHFRD